MPDILAGPLESAWNKLRSILNGWENHFYMFIWTSLFLKINIFFNAGKFVLVRAFSLFPDYLPLLLHSEMYFPPNLRFSLLKGTNDITMTEKHTYTTLVISIYSLVINQLYFIWMHVFML